MTPGLGLYNFSQGFGEFLTGRAEEIYQRCRIMNHSYIQVYPSRTLYPPITCCCCWPRLWRSSVRPSSSSSAGTCSSDSPENIQLVRIVLKIYNQFEWSSKYTNARQIYRLKTKISHDKQNFNSNNVCKCFPTKMFIVRSPSFHILHILRFGGFYIGAEGLHAGLLGFEGFIEELKNCMLDSSGSHRTISRFDEFIFSFIYSNLGHICSCPNN